MSVRIHFICLPGDWCFIYAFCINWRICLLVSKQDFYIIWCSCRFAILRRVDIVEQALLTLIVQQWVNPQFLTGFVILCCSIFSFLCSVFFTSLFVLFSFVLQTIVLSVRIRSVVSDHLLHIQRNITIISG